MLSFSFWHVNFDKSTNINKISFKPDVHRFGYPSKCSGWTSFYFVLDSVDIGLFTMVLNSPFSLVQLLKVSCLPEFSQQIIFPETGFAQMSSENVKWRNPF